MWQSLVSSTKAQLMELKKILFGKLAESYRLKLLQLDRFTRVNSSNFSTAAENHMYFKLDNVIYQVSNATVNGATVDAGIEEIATVTWTGFGTTMKELTGTRNNAVSVFGGI